MPAFTAIKIGISALAPDSSIVEGFAGQLELSQGLPLRASLTEISGLILVPADRGGFDIDVTLLASMRPDLPIEEERTLVDPLRLHHFLMRVHAYAAWQELCASALSRSALMDFHARYKYQLMACSPHAYRELGRRLGQSTGQPLRAFANAYFSTLMEALSMLPTPGLHCNTLMHLSGYFKRQLSAAERGELEHSILSYRRGIEPLTAPLTLLRHHLHNHPNSYLSKQVYLQQYSQIPASTVRPTLGQ